MKGLLEALALDLKARGDLDVREAFIDGSFALDKKGAPRLETQSAARAQNIMAVADRHGLPVAVQVESATPHEVKLVVPTLSLHRVSQDPCWRPPRHTPPCT